MADKADLRKTGKICSKCGKRITSAEQVGSLTSYLFQPFNCTCSEDSLASGEQSGAQSGGQSGGKSGGRSGTDSAGRSSTGEREGRTSFCSDCGLQKVSGGAVGSITAFMFQDTRCKCPPRDSSADNAMAEKFWKLKQAEAGRTFDHSAKKKASAVPLDVSINLLPGAIIGGVYSIIDLIGAGGMGEIYRANHLTLGKVVALKLIPPDLVTARSWQRFQNEAKSIASLDHVNLVKVTDLGVHEGCLPFYAMEYINGRSLAEMLAREGRPPLNVVLDIFMQVCDGVDFAHRKGLVHRDLKPANIMLARTEANKLQVKILDFGLVKLTQKDRDQQSLTAVGDVMGSPYYMSPEQCIGGKVDNRSDIYGIGCTMFECLTMRPPFVGASAVEILTRQHTADPPTLASLVGARVYPESLEVVVAKLLRKNPVERYQTLLELRGDLEKVGRGKEVAPFYSSRTKAAPGANRAATRTEETAESLKESTPKPVFKIAALASVLVMIVAFGLARIQGQASKQSSQKLTINRDNPLLALPQKNKSKDRAPASAKDSSPFSTVVQEGGTKWRVFHFPTDCDLGEISDRVVTTQGATGVVKFPVNTLLSFNPAPPAVEYPSYLKRFRPGDIYEIKISQNNFLDSQSMDDTLAALTALPDVQKLNLDNATELTNKSSASIDKFKSLKELDIGPCNLNVDTLTKLKILNHLETIRLNNRVDSSKLLKILRNSPVLKVVELTRSITDIDGLVSVAAIPQLEGLSVGKLISNSPDCVSQCCRTLSKSKMLQVLNFNEQVLSLADIELISSIKTLEQLHFKTVAPPTLQTNSEALRLLSKLPNLMALSFKEMPLSEDTLSTIPASFKRLQTLTIENQKQLPQLRQLIKAYPGLSLEVYGNNTSKPSCKIRFHPGQAAKTRI